MNIGIICDLSYTHSPCFRNYYYSVRNIFGSVKIVSGVDDLPELDIVFIGNDHYRPHLNIWDRNNFIDRCNVLGIKVVVFTAETIYSPHFLTNGQYQATLQRFKNLYQYVIDINDMSRSGKKQMRGLMSKSYKDTIPHVDHKIDRILFIGKYKEPEYERRRKVLESIDDLDIIPSIPQWEDYMAKMAQYRFVLSPISNGNFFPLRYYEILLAKSIPLQQVEHNTLQYYQTESQFEDCIYFEDVTELKSKLFSFRLWNSQNELWMEDHMKDLLESDGII